MPELTQPDGSHERDTVEGKWADAFAKCFYSILHKHGIKGIEEGPDYFEFVDGNKTITIKFTSKS